MTLLRIVEGLLLGGVTGFISGLLGVGGGFILVPLLTLAGVPIHTAIGTSVAFIVCTSMAGLVQHIRQGSIDLIVALILGLPAAIMAWMSAQFSNLLSPATLQTAFGLLLVAVLLFFRFAPLLHLAQAADASVINRSCLYVLHRQRVVADVPYIYSINVISAMISGAGAGTIAGFFGVSGGFLLVPTMVLVLHLPLQVTIGSCLAVNVFPAFVATLTHWQLGNVDLELWLPLAVAGMLGSQVGARCMLRVAPELLRKFFQGLVTLAALYMLLKGVLE
jgi:uncharacterized membrane protein YfcA